MMQRPPSQATATFLPGASGHVPATEGNTRLNAPDYVHNLGGARESPLDLVLRATGLYYFDWVDVGQRAVHTSAELRRLLVAGTDAQAETWDALLELVHPDDRVEFERKILFLLARRTLLRETIRFCIGGAYLPVEIVALATGGEGRQPMRITGAIHRRDAERAWQREASAAEERLRLVVQAAQVGTWDWPDMSVDEVVFSDGLYELLGYDRERFRLNVDHFWALIHDEDAAAVREALAPSVGSEGASEISFRIQFAGRGYRWVRSVTKVTDDGTGRKALTGVLFDVHERTLARRTSGT